MKKVFLLGLILFLITGCTPYSEANHLAVVDMIGLSYQDQEYQLYLTVVEPEKKENDTENQHKYYKVTGRSLGEAFEKANQISKKSTYLEHLSIILLDTSLLDDKTEETLSFLQKKLTQINYALLAVDAKMEEVLTHYPNHQTIESFMKKEARETGNLTTLTFDEVMTQFLDPERSAYLPLITIKNKKLIASGLRILGTSITYTPKEASISYLLNHKISALKRVKTIDHKAYQLTLSSLKATLSVKKEKLIVSVSGILASDDRDKEHLSSLKEAVQTELNKEIRALLKKEQAQKLTTTSFKNTLYFKLRNKKAYEAAFSNYHITVKTTLTWKGSDSFDKS